MLQRVLQSPGQAGPPPPFVSGRTGKTGIPQPLGSEESSAVHGMKRTAVEGPGSGTPASEHATGSPTILGRDSLPLTGEHLPELPTEAVVEPGIEERVAAGGAHGEPVAEQLDEEEVVLVDEIDVDVTDDVEDVDGEPADPKGCHHQHDEAEDLPLPQAVELGLALRGVARHHSVPQLHRDADVGEGNGREGQDVGDDQGAVGIGQALRLLLHPELLADGETLLPKLHVVRVGDGGGHQPAGEQPDAPHHRDAAGDRDALLQGVHGGVVPAGRKTGEPEPQSIPPAAQGEGWLAVGLGPWEAEPCQAPGAGARPQTAAGKGLAGDTGENGIPSLCHGARGSSRPILLVWEAGCVAGPGTEHPSRSLSLNLPWGPQPALGE